MKKKLRNTLKTNWFDLNTIKSGIGYYAAFGLTMFLFAACATYHQRNEKLFDAVYSGNFEAVNKLLENDAKWEKWDRNKLLFYLNKGTVQWMQGNWTGSNTYFQKADLFVEDYDKKIGDAVLTMLVNARLSTYPGENFERILLHYYGALNYMNLGQLDEALVEGKRMLEAMQRVTDKYKSANKYRRDAFAHNLLGLIYDARGEYNDAFIAYKNAWEVYKEDYLTTFNTPIPVQLKKDILRTAYKTGFMDEVRFFEKEFSMKYEPESESGKGQVLFFWNNGLGPVKDQITINISIIPYGNGWVQFVNWDYGIQIPIQVDSKDDRNGLLDMKFVRMAFPKYVSRTPLYEWGKVTAGGNAYNLEMAENINAIAFKSLSDRMARELTIGILRVALKQLAVYKAQQDKNNQGLALAATVYGAVSEQADTRNWQLLPYSINYSRITLPEGSQKLVFQAGNKTNQPLTKEFNVDVKKGQTKFLATQTLDFTGYSE